MVSHTVHACQVHASISLLSPNTQVPWLELPIQADSDGEPCLRTARSCSQSSKELDFGLRIWAQNPWCKNCPRKAYSLYTQCCRLDNCFLKEALCGGRRVSVYIYIYAGTSNNLLFLITFGLQRLFFFYVFVWRSCNHRMVLLFNINKALSKERRCLSFLLFACWDAECHGIDAF